MSLSLEKSVTHFMVGMIFSAYLVQAVSRATLHNDALLDILLACICNLYNAKEIESF